MAAITLEWARLRAVLALNRFSAKGKRRAKRGATPNCEAHSQNVAEQAGAARPARLTSNPDHRLNRALPARISRLPRRRLHQRRKLAV